MSTGETGDSTGHRPNTYHRPRRHSTRHRLQRKLTKRRITKAVFIVILVVVSLAAAYLLSE